MDRILIIRGGALGDFMLTLPALKALRDACPSAHIEILGYKHIAVLAENRFYAQAVRSIDYGPLSSFFAQNSELSRELVRYFAGFDLVISYLYDPDQIFENNLRRAGVKNFVRGPHKVVENAGHAARQLARPIEQLGIKVGDLAETIFLTQSDRQFARDFLRGRQQPILAVHPGSGSKEKIWPLENWLALFSRSGGFPTAAGSLGKRPSLVVCGEADQAECARLEREWMDRDIRFAKNLPLPQLAAVLEHSIFMGHDSGISHLAAGVGANCVLLYGPTDPDIWAPMNKNVRVLRPQSGRLSDLEIQCVEATVKLCSSRLLYSS